MELLRISSHQFKENTINILYNKENKKYFVMDLLGWFNPSEYFYTEEQCYYYIKSVYGFDWNKNE